MSSSRLATAMYHFNEIAANGQTAKYVKRKGKWSLLHVFIPKQIVYDDL